MRRMNWSGDLRVRAVGASDGLSDGEFTGYASVFGNIDSYGDVVAPGAFTDTLADLKASGRVLPVLYGHDFGNPANNIGEVLDATEDEHGLLVRCRLDMDDDNAAKVYRLMKGRRVNEMSFAFDVLDAEPGEVNGTPVNMLTRVKLYEVSVVPIGANPKAGVLSVKADDTTGDPDATPEDDTPDDNQPTAADVLHDVEDYVAGLLADLDNAADTATTGAEKGTVAKHRKAATTATAPVIALLKARSGSAAGRLTEHDMKDVNRTMDNLHTKAGNWKADLDRTRRQIAEGQAVYAALGIGGNKGGTYRKDANGTAHRVDGHGNTSRARLATGPALKSAVLNAGRNLAAGNLKADGISIIDGTPPVPLKTLTTTDPQRTFALLDALDVVTVTGGEQFQYIRQNARDLNAAPVPIGELKPTSNVSLETITDTLQRVAHISAPIDQYSLTDSAEAQTFLAGELRYGVMRAVEDLFVSGLFAASGAIVNPFNARVLDTLRTSVTALQNLAYEPALFLVSPATWQALELDRADGSGAFVFGSTPVNAIEHTLFGIPVAVSTALPAGKAVTLARDAAALASDAVVKMETDMGGALFDRNQVRVRSEGRFQPVIRHADGIVLSDLAAPAGD
ncbi:HK97 family phage prohead protease [Corynebacterium variabile]|uniref:HK97 family phage prohead protease n=1 Tax=Corynebacterium variabile TaxID=1727 RepID=UPI003FCFC765